MSGGKASKRKYGHEHTRMTEFPRETRPMQSIGKTPESLCFASPRKDRAVANQHGCWVRVNFQGLEREWKRLSTRGTPMPVTQCTGKRKKDRMRQASLSVFVVGERPKSEPFGFSWWPSAKAWKHVQTRPLHSAGKHADGWPPNKAFGRRQWQALRRLAGHTRGTVIKDGMEARQGHGDSSSSGLVSKLTSTVAPAGQGFWVMR